MTHIRAGYLLLHALDLGMEDRLQDMKRVVKQKYHIKSMLDFAEARRAPPQSVIKPFFSRLMADERVLQDYDESCDVLFKKLVERAEVKKQARWFFVSSLFFLWGGSRSVLLLRLATRGCE